MRPILVDIGSIYADEVLLLRVAVDDDIVNNTALTIRHTRVLSLAIIELRNIVCADFLQEGCSEPIFVFSHYPPSDVKGGDERLTAMLGACENLLYFYGHTHWWLSDETAHNYKGINCINVPKTTEPIEYDCGIGAYVRVYENEIVVRMKDFHDEMYMEDYVYRYEIK